MHHTFNDRQAVAESRRQVEDGNVFLTVDYLFYEGNILDCERNDNAWGQICNVLPIITVQVTASNSPMYLRTESVECTHMGLLGGGRNNHSEHGAVLLFTVFLLCFQLHRWEWLTNCKYECYPNLEFFILFYFFFLQPALTLHSQGHPKIITTICLCELVLNFNRIKIYFNEGKSNFRGKFWKLLDGLWRMDLYLYIFVRSILDVWNIVKNTV